MSLRLRLTLIYSVLLSGVVLLLSIVIYSMASVVIINQVDGILEQAVNQIINVIQVDQTGDLRFSPETLQLSKSIHYQIWSGDQRLLHYSDHMREFSDEMDDEVFSQSQSTYRNVENSDIPLRVLTVPLMINGEQSGWLQVGMILTEVRYTQRLLQLVFGFSAFFAIIIAGIVIWLVTSQALEPLAEMAQITNRITSTDDLSKRIPVDVGRNDEISTLVLTFNQTLVRLERLFNAQRRFLADVSHELRTPLTVIKGNIGLMRIIKNYDEESLKSIESEVDRLNRLVGDLLLMAHAESGKLPLMFVPVEIDDLLFEVFEEMKVLSDGHHNIRIGNIQPAIVTADRDRLKQVFLNLGSNAIKFSPEGGLILLSLYVRSNWVQIIVSDEGPGIPEEELGWLFERFYRSDKARSRANHDVGFGLGLPIAYWIVRNHRGRIDVETVDGKGATFSVWLPLSQVEIPTRPLNQRDNQK